MKKIFILTVTLISLAVLLALCISAKDFSDVKKNAWYYDAVDYVSNEGIIVGMTDTEFKPGSNMTRAQFVTILSRLAEADTAGEGDNTGFADIKAGKWYSDAVGWAVDCGIVNGYEEGGKKLFKPDNNVSRQELAKLIVSYLDYIDVEIISDKPLTKSFTDAGKFQSWAKEYIEKLRSAGLIGGDDSGRFNPQSTASRAEVATIVRRFMSLGIDGIYAKSKEFLRTSVCEKHGRIEVLVSAEHPLTDDALETLIMKKVSLSDSRADFDPVEMMKLQNKLGTIYAGGSLEFDLPFRLSNIYTGECTKEMILRLQIFKMGKNSPLEELTLYCPGNLIVPKVNSALKSIKDKPSVITYQADSADMDKLARDAAVSLESFAPGVISSETCRAVFRDPEKVKAEVQAELDKLLPGQTGKTPFDAEMTLEIWSNDGDMKYVAASTYITVTVTVSKKPLLDGSDGLLKMYSCGTVPSDAELLERAEMLYGSFATDIEISRKNEVNDPNDALIGKYYNRTDVLFSGRINGGEPEVLFPETPLEVFVKLQGETLREDSDFTLVKDGKACAAVIISYDASTKEVYDAKALQDKTAELAGVYIPVINESRENAEYRHSGYGIYMGGTVSEDPAAMGEATSKQYRVGPYDSVFTAKGRTEEGNRQAAEYLISHLVKEGVSLVVKASDFGTFDTALPETKHNFDSMCTSFYGDPYSWMSGKEAYENGSMFYDIVDYGVKEISLNAKWGTSSDGSDNLHYFRELIKKFGDAGITVRLYNDWFGSFGQNCYDYLADLASGKNYKYKDEAEKEAVLAEMEKFDASVSELDLDDYEGKAALCREFIETYKKIAPKQYALTENSIKEFVDTYGDLDAISTWGYYDEPEGCYKYMENVITIELFNKYDEKHRPVYINLNPMGYNACPDADGEYMLFESLVTEAPFYTYDRYGVFYDDDGILLSGAMDFFIEDYPSPTGRFMTGSSAESLNVKDPDNFHTDFYMSGYSLDDDGYYYNLEVNRNYAIDNGKDCGITMAGMKVGGDYHMKDGEDNGQKYADIDFEFSQWETNLVVAYGYRYFESYTYYHCHDFAILGLNNIPTFRWGLMRRCNSYLLDVGNEMLKSDIDMVFHLENTSGIYDYGTAVYYPYHGLGEIDGKDAIVTFWENGSMALTNKCFASYDRDRNVIKVNNFTFTEYYDHNSSSWKPLSANKNVSLEGTTATVTLEKAQQIIFR